MRVNISIDPKLHKIATARAKDLMHAGGLSSYLSQLVREDLAAVNESQAPYAPSVLSKPQAAAPVLRKKKA